MEINFERRILVRIIINVDDFLRKKFAHFTTKAFKDNKRLRFTIRSI